MTSRGDSDESILFPGQRAVILPRPVVRSMRGVAADLFPTDIGLYPAASGHEVRRPEGSPQAILIACVSGEGWLEMGGKRSLVDIGHFVVIPPGTPHAYGAGIDPWTIYWLHFSGIRMPVYCRELSASDNDPIFQADDMPSFIRLFEEIYRTLEHGYGEDRLLAAGTALAHLLGRIAVARRRSINSTEYDTDRIGKTIEWMRGNLSLRVGVSDLAAMANLSASRFAALFKRRTAYSVVDYFTRLKLQAACGLLDGSKLSVKEIAARLGFDDQLYFARAFKRIHDLSPTAYRSVKKG